MDSPHAGLPGINASTNAVKWRIDLHTDQTSLRRETLSCTEVQHGIISDSGEVRALSAGLGGHRWVNRTLSVAKS